MVKRFLWCRNPNDIEFILCVATRACIKHHGITMHTKLVCSALSQYDLPLCVVVWLDGFITVIMYKLLVNYD